MEDAVLYLCSYSLIFVYNILQPYHLNVWGSHGPVQPLPRVLRYGHGYCLSSPVFLQDQQTTVDWDYTADLKYREIQNLFPAGICLITSPLKKNWHVTAAPLFVPGSSNLHSYCRDLVNGVRQTKKRKEKKFFAHHIKKQSFKDV